MRKPVDSNIATFGSHMTVIKSCLFRELLQEEREEI
jgi:hypothetical protein